MRRNAFAALAGALFGLGLMLSGMTDTTKVQGWLDLFGAWDPTLAFVMGGAILPMAVAWRLTGPRATLGTPIPAPADPQIGRDLALGAVLFGMGWGLSGLCPGPALAALSQNGLAGLAFLGAMLLGMRATPAIRTRLALA